MSIHPRACQHCGAASRAYAFDDISLIPRHYPADIPEDQIPRSRKDVSLETRVSRNVTLKIPVLASYMYTVCEAPMAIALARLGGMGIIHRWMTIDQQVAEVEKVKRAENVVIDKPYTIRAHVSKGDVVRAMKEYGVGGMLVTEEDGKLLGIITTRDIDGEGDDSEAAARIMTPRERLVVGTRNTTTDEAISLFNKHKIEKLPLVDPETDKLVGLISKKDIRLRSANKIAARDKEEHLVVAASIGIREKNFIERTEALLDAGADVIVLAIANGYLPSCVQAVEELRKQFPDIDLIAGDVAEYEGAARLFQAGADGVLAGIGPGSACETRRIAGVGAPQFSSILWSAKAAREHGGTIIADGGIRYPGDVAKALVAGASGVIMGGVLAGTDESPGEIIEMKGKLMKQHVGLASQTSKEKLSMIDGKSEQPSREGLPLRSSERAKEGDYEAFYTHIAGEGVESAFVPYRGSVWKVLREYVGGLRSSMTYLGARSVEDLWRAGEEGYYTEVTEAGWREGHPHSLDIQRD